ncbi:MAG: deoxyguanosinetriphosphate triphosphohydrolase [Lachnospiraceae bacterium]|nr:deoxyguanosinetriphosphate triphosphohydrolase [Lachnospiraceae bacterium]MDY5742855.1 deoxyguanosinetriphosphate triphosphohydrolase [Lachnospiraceae bacterium]
MEWRQLLCPKRMRQGRMSAEYDLRTEFEKDYHRILGSASFRRMQDKTQVFPLDRSDFIRTRLTHSLEVSSFAKSLGQSVSEQIMARGLEADFDRREASAICDILQCAGLIHDIGNPPFGHFGETCIREWFIRNLPSLQFRGQPLEKLLSTQQISDFYHFEGNTQAVRLVSKLHFLVDEHGMNLTFGLLGTIMKYPISSLEINRNSGQIRTKKMGYFQADEAVFERVQRENGTFGRRHPLTYLLEAADDIAYCTADIEDAFKKGYISLGQLREELAAADDGGDFFCLLVDILERQYTKAVDKKIDKKEAYAVQNWLVRIQGILLKEACASFIDHYDEIMCGTYPKDLFCGSPIERIMRLLGDMAFRYVFVSRPIVGLEVATATIFNGLLERFVPAAICWDSDQPMTEIEKRLIAMISDNYKYVYSVYGQDLPDEQRLYLRLLLVTDYICGMTDSYAKDLYQRFAGIK